MKESYIEGLANHNDPESGAGGRKVTGEAMTVVRTGGVLSRENFIPRVPTLSRYTEGNTDMCKMARACLTLRGRRHPACSETPCERTGRAFVFPQEMGLSNVPERTNFRSRR